MFQNNIEFNEVTVTESNSPPECNVENSTNYKEKYLFASSDEFHDVVDFPSQEMKNEFVKTGLQVITESNPVEEKKTTKCNKNVKKEETCEICAEKFNKINKIPIKCEYCDFTACRKCCCTFILNETDPKCMDTANCNRVWSRKFINSKMTKQFVNFVFKKHREQVLYDREISLLPATQPLVEHQMKLEKIDNEIRELSNEITQIKLKIFTMQRERTRRVNTYNNVDNETSVSQRTTFIRPCPDNNCRGFLSSQWKCGICEKWTCSQCYVIKGLERNVEEHVCHPDDLETAALILRETKSCPTCGMGIFKIGGCDQMFCTQCNTAFSWKTGKIQTSNIHNPHYFEWFRRTAGNIEGVTNNEVMNINVCNDARNNFTLNHRLSGVVRQKISLLYSFDVSKNMRNLLDNFDKILRRAIHLNMVEIPHYHEPANFITYNQELRIRYLRNQIDEAQFKVLLQRKEKKREKNHEIYNILQMVYDTTVDIIHKIYSPLIDVKSKGSFENTPSYEYLFKPLKEIVELVKYANEFLLDVSKTYDTRPLSFDNSLKLTISAKALSKTITLEG